jgi:hypothetical protein
MKASYVSSLDARTSNRLSWSNVNATTGQVRVKKSNGAVAKLHEPG